MKFLLTLLAVTVFAQGPAPASDQDAAPALPDILAARSGPHIDLLNKFLAEAKANNKASS